MVVILAGDEKWTYLVIVEEKRSMIFE